MLNSNITRLAFLGFFFTATFWNGAAFCSDYVVELGQVSSSGKTISVNQGYNDRINTEDYGILLVEEKVIGKGKAPVRTVYKPVAKLKAVKVFSNSSIWIAFKTFMPEKIKKGASLLLLSESALLNGRKDLAIDRKAIVDTPSKISTTIKEELVDDGSELFEKARAYDEGRVLHDKRTLDDGDATLVDLEVWKEDALPGEMTYEGFYKSPSAEDFSKRIRVQRFEKMVAMFMKKYNDPKFTLEGLYEEQKRDPIDATFQDKLMGGNYYENAMKASALDKRRKDEIAADLRSRGEGWSDDYSDEELSELLYNVGVIREKERRKLIGAQAFDYQVFASLGLNLLDNENLEDDRNSEQSKSDVELSFEWYLLKKVEDLKAFSLEASVRRSQDAFSTGDFNATGVEYSGAFGINWHPFQLANVLEKNIFFIGVLFRYGYANYEIGSLNEEGNYQVLSFPGIRAGVKYNFSNGYGLRLAGSFENIIGDRIIKTEDEGQLPDRVNHLEGKLSIGLSRFF